MPEIPQEVRDAVLDTYAAWRPYAAATQEPEPAGSAFDGILERLDVIEARIAYNRANPVFPAAGEE